MTDWIAIVRDILAYLRANRKYWLIPVVIVLFVFGFLLATAGTAPVPVFVYPVA